MKSIQFKDPSDMLETLNGKDRGKYYLCQCPSCFQDEAYVYKKYMNQVTCNRKNKCGETIKISFTNKEKSTYIKKIYDAKEVTNISVKQKDQIEWLTKFVKHMQDNVVNQALEDGYRGLSNETVRPHMLDLKNEKMVSLMFNKIPDLINKDYGKMSFMTKRNLVFPIKGEDGNVDSLLLRSTIDPDISKKEIQLFVNPKGDARYFSEDLSGQSDIVIISESVIDGLSFREIDPNVNLIMMSGSRKYRQIEEYIRENKAKFENKIFLIAVDNDQAGEELKSRLTSTLKSENLSYVEFNYPDEIEDPNHFLQENKYKFHEAYKESINSVRNEKGKDMSAEEKKSEILLKNMTYLESSKKAIATIQYGEFYLNNITVEDFKGSPIINYPSKRGNDDVWREVFKFKEDSLDKKMIEGSLLKNYIELQHGIKKEVKNEKIQIGTNNNEYSPKVLRNYEFSNGNAAINIGYRNLYVNNLIIGKNAKGKEYVGFPYYKNKDDDLKSFVYSSKHLVEEILDKAKEKMNKKKEHVFELTK